MALDFPNAPTNGQEHFDAGSAVTYVYQSSTNSWEPKSVFPKATVAEIQAGANDVKFLTSKGLKDSGMWPLGVGQTWQTPARAKNTNYTNTTGRPIMVNVCANGYIAGTLTLYVGGVLVASMQGTGSGGYDDGTYVSAIVPDGAVYSVGGSATLVSWAELR